MIDFHNHILHDVDDGPKSIDISIDMIREASRQGVTDIVNTVHFQHPKMYNKNVSLDFLNNKKKELEKILNDENININIHLSAEVFYLPNLVEISDNPITTIGNKKYMLIEFTSNIFPKNYEKEFYDLQMSGITPIIAHPERYRFIAENLDILKEWIDKDYVIQVDCGSILGHFGIKTKIIAEKMIENSFVHLIGSDAHNNKKRNFCIMQAYNLIEEKTSSDYVSILKSNVDKILIGEKVDMMDLPYLKENKVFINYINIIKKYLKFS